MTIWNVFRSVTIVASLALGGSASLADGRYVDMSSYERGKLHYNAGRFGLAVKHFQLAVDRGPDFIEALNGLAASYDRLGRYDLAARHYGRALGADPDSTQTLNNIGFSYQLQQRIDLAVAYLRDAHSRDTDDPVVAANWMAAKTAVHFADLQRAAEAARTETAAAPPGREAAAVETPAPSAAPPRGRVKPWIERARPKIQMLVTRPQMALAAMAEDAGLAPELAGYRHEQLDAADLLPDPISAPLVRDDQPRLALNELIWPRFELIGLKAFRPIGYAPAKPEDPRAARAARLVAREVTLAALDAAAPVDPIEDTVRPLANERFLPLIEVSNGTGRLDMAKRIRSRLKVEGIMTRRLTSANGFTRMKTTIYYREGWRDCAEHLARVLPTEIEIEVQEDQTSDIRLELGRDLLSFDRVIYDAVGRSSGAYPS